MKNKTIITILLIILSSSLHPAGKESVKTDWEKGIIVAQGKSPLSIDDNGSAVDDESGRKTSISSSRDRAFDSAREKAVHEAVLTINEISIDSSTKIRDLVINDPEVRQRITHFIHEYAKFKEEPAGYLKAGCRLELKLGYLLNALNYTFPQDPFPVRDDTEISTKYTSMIIDMRGFRIKPMLLPAVLNESGLEVYGRNNISPYDAVKHLAVSYAYTEKEAIKHKKAGRHPFYCNTLRELNGNPVISDEDIKRIYSHKENLSYLRKCRVIFIIDR